MQFNRCLTSNGCMLCMFVKTRKRKSIVTVPHPHHPPLPIRPIRAEKRAAEGRSEKRRSGRRRRKSANENTKRKMKRARRSRAVRAEGRKFGKSRRSLMPARTRGQRCANTNFCSTNRTTWSSTLGRTTRIWITTTPSGGRCPNFVPSTMKTAYGAHFASSASRCSASRSSRRPSNSRIASSPTGSWKTGIAIRPNASSATKPVRSTSETKQSCPMCPVMSLRRTWVNYNFTDFLNFTEPRGKILNFWNTSSFGTKLQLIWIFSDTLWLRPNPQSPNWTNNLPATLTLTSTCTVGGVSRHLTRKHWRRVWRTDTASWRAKSQLIRTILMPGYFSSTYRLIICIKIYICKFLY